MCIRDSGRASALRLHHYSVRHLCFPRQRALDSAPARWRLLICGCSAAGRVGDQAGERRAYPFSTWAFGALAVLPPRCAVGAGSFVGFLTGPVWDCCAGRGMLVCRDGVFPPFLNSKSSVLMKRILVCGLAVMAALGGAAAEAVT